MLAGETERGREGGTASGNARTYARTSLGVLGVASVDICLALFILFSQFPQSRR
jgi:hypothetical protein